MTLEFCLIISQLARSDMAPEASLSAIYLWIHEPARG